MLSQEQDSLQRNRRGPEASAKTGTYGTCEMSGKRSHTPARSKRFTILPVYTLSNAKARTLKKNAKNRRSIHTFLSFSVSASLSFPSSVFRRRRGRAEEDEENRADRNNQKINHDGAQEIHHSGVCTEAQGRGKSLLRDT